MVQYLASRPGPHGWLTLGDADGSPGRLATDLAAAVGAIDPAVPEDFRDMLEHGAAPADCAALIAERLLTGDRREHNLLDRPRDRPWRTAVGAAMVSWVALIFLFGAADRLLVQMGISYEVQLVLARVLVFALPAAVFLVVKRACEELRSADPPEIAPPGRAPAREPGR
jgi:hypothetical protein